MWSKCKIVKLYLSLWNNKIITSLNFPYNKNKFRVTSSLPGKFNKRFTTICYLQRKFIPLYCYPSLSLLYVILLFTVFQWIIKEKANTNCSLYSSNHLIYQIVTYKYQHEQLPGQYNTIANYMSNKQSQFLRILWQRFSKLSTKGIFAVMVKP